MVDYYHKDSGGQVHVVLFMPYPQLLCSFAGVRASEVYSMRPGAEENVTCAACMRLEEKT